MDTYYRGCTSFLSAIIRETHTYSHVCAYVPSSSIYTQTLSEDQSDDLLLRVHELAIESKVSCTIESAENIPGCLLQTKVELCNHTSVVQEANQVWVT